MSEHLANSSTNGAGDSLDRGLAEAFGDTSRPRASHPSVLKALQARTGSRLGVQLESEGLEAAPVKVTDEVKALRDPSGRYQVLGEIGRGGMGIVYKGRDQDLGRDVAMKVLKDEYASRADVLARFVEEAQIGGQLQHPGIVPVYELGLQSGERPYFAMKLVKGETLAAQLVKRSDATQERRRLLGIFEQVCQTVAYAHARHVVHRDLKPANVMIGAFGEVQVVDWGFAKVLQRNSADEIDAVKVGQHSVIETARSRADSGSHSVAGSMMGTPAYMPPEQALGDIARVDERSDVFALGAILCELLTGEAPYREQDGDLIRQAAKAELDGAHERLAKCGADDALVALCKECLAPSQRARPASAAEVANRVSAYLTSVEDRARQAQVRAAEARLKHRVTLMSAGVGVLVLALAAGGWMWLDSQARARRAEATQRVASAMSAASGAHGRAQSAGLDASLWSTAVSSAEQLVSLAASDDVDAKARADAAALLASVQEEARAANVEFERQKRDAEMLAQLELARIPADEDIRNQVQEQRRLDSAYASAFATYLDGASLFEQPFELAFGSLRRGSIGAELACSLDHWGLVRDRLSIETDPPDPAGTARIRELAQQLDSGDAWRSQLRALLPRALEEGERLRDLAEHADFAAMSAVGCRVLSRALWRAGQGEPALTVLRRGLERYPTDFDLCFQLAADLETFGAPHWEESLTTFRIAQAIRPSQREVLHRQIALLESLQRYVDAERLARVLLTRDPSVSHALLHIGIALRGQGRIDEAIASFREAVDRDAKYISVYIELGKTLDDRGLLDEEVEILRKATEANPLDSRAFINLGPVLTRQGKHDQAIAFGRQAVLLAPTDSMAHGNLGFALLRSGRPEEAIESYSKMIEIAPKDARSHESLGEALEELGRLDEAVASYCKAIELDPKLAVAFFNLGLALGGQGKQDEAIASYRRAIELEPKEAKTHCNLGNSLRAQHRVEEAIASYRRAIELNPKLAQAHHGLGIVLREQGRLDEAIPCYRTALELDPTNATFHRGLAYVFEMQGALDEAIASYRRALELEPKRASDLSNLGNCLWRQEKTDEAVECFQRAVEIDPRYAPPRVNLGQVFGSKGDLDRALQEFREAEKLFAQDPSPFGRDWLEQSRRYISQTEQLIAQGGGLKDVLEGRAAVSTGEWSAAIQFGYDQKRYREVLELTEATLRDAPELIGDDKGLYNAACCAALLAVSADAEVAADDRSRARELARTWLSREIERWLAQIEQGGPDAGNGHGMLNHVQGDPDFATVRGAAIDALPERERAGWRELWKRIEEGASK